MAYPLTVAASAMRAINRSAILDIIRRESPISRNAIASRLDISLPTVMRIVDELIDEGFVRLHGNTERSSIKRHSLLEFNAEEHLVLGVDLGGTKIYGAISDLGGNILDEVNAGRHRATAEDNFDSLVALIDTLMAGSNLHGRRVLGIGVGVPGVTLHKDGIVQWAYPLKWKNFPLKARLAEHYRLPVTVDNDVNLAALGELWFGVGQNAQNMVLVALSTGIGSGIIIDGALYRGAREASGEIGNMLPGREFLEHDFKEFGALEAMASATGIADRARKALKRRRTPDELESLVAEDVFEAARKDQKWAWETIHEAVDYLAIAIANLMVSFDPELIVLGGGLTNSAGMLVEPILHRLEGTIPVLPNLVVSNLGWRATVMGAIINVLHNTSDFYVVHKLT